MNYNESIAYIESLIPTLERPTLARMQLFMQDEGNVQNKIKSFHVGGTNGKGSTATILDAVLSSMGLKVGRFTGPHIMRFNERFSINGKSVSDEEFAKLATTVREKSESFGARHPDFGRLTWFEFLTAMAFFYFWDNAVDCAVLEVGLGGRFDATNVADNILATVITNVDLDHMHILGDTVTKIAFEKSGIMRKDVPVITSASGDALVELQRRASEVGTKLIMPATERPAFISIHDDKRIKDSLSKLSLDGPHQQRNALLAITAVLASPLSERKEQLIDALPSCLTGIYFSGRMQFIEDQNIIIDGAHNPAGARALRKALDEKSFAKMHDGSFTNQKPEPRCFVLGLFGNKDVHAFLRELVREGDRVIAVEAEVRRVTYPKEQIANACEELGIKATHAGSMKEALEFAQREGFQNETIVTGSFAVLKELMLYLGWQSVDAGRPSIKSLVS